MERKEYNGWTNYETWLANLWFDNDGIGEQMRERARELLLESEGDEMGAHNALIEEMKGIVDEIVENTVSGGSGFVLDFVNAGICEVNWQELAEAYFEGVVWFDEDEAYTLGKERGEFFKSHNVTREDAYEAEQNARDFSPFEHTAHKLNEAVNSETAWERFEDGISDVISELPKKEETNED